MKDHAVGSGVLGLGSVNWNVTTVKLELEVRGEIRRLPGVAPQRLVRV